MKVHANAALGPAGRVALCELVDRGMRLRAAAAHRWWHRRRLASARGLASGSWVGDRWSRPHRQPRRLSAAEEEPILRARRETGLGPGRLAGIVRRARSTIWKVLRRHGLSRRRRSPRESSRRYEWSRPGALLHVDAARLPRFRRPGDRVHGRSTASRKDRPGMGFVYLHACVDDHSRATPTSSSTETSAPRLQPRSCAGRSNTSPRWGSLHPGGDERQRQLLPLPRLQSPAPTGGYTPDPHPALHPALEWKVERFFQTLKREWAYAHAWPNSATRTRALASFLRYYNRQRPHSSLGDRPPITRVHNPRGQNS
jgi:Integrase core domain